MLLLKIILTVGAMLLLMVATDSIVIRLRHKPYNVKKIYSGKPRSGKSILIAKERAFFEKLQNSNSKEDEKR